MMANRSTDGGLIFGARNRTGVAFSNSAAPDEAVYGPGNSITALTEVDGRRLRPERQPTRRHALPGRGRPAPPGSGEDASIGIDPADNKPVVVYEIQSDPLHSWPGASPAGSPTETNINTLGQWGPQNIISADNIERR